MVSSIIPKRSTLHRTAAVSLFRALLTQCRAAPLAEQQRNELQNIVRNRFKALRHEQSHRRLKLSFQAGYEAIDHLDAAAAGDEPSKSYICTLLERAPQTAKSKPPRPKLSKKLRKSIKAANGAAKPSKQTRPSILDRPLPLEKLSGRRHVPVFFNANHIPVLRTKKPQPPHLSGYLKRKIQRRARLHDVRWRLIEETKEAELEDQWDYLIAQLTPLNEEQSGPEETTWRATAKEAEAAVGEHLQRESDKDTVMAAKMREVVERERALYEQEKAERKRAKDNRRLEHVREYLKS